MLWFLIALTAAISYPLCGALLLWFFEKMAKSELNESNFMMGMVLWPVWLTLFLIAVPFYFAKHLVRKL